MTSSKFQIRPRRSLLSRFSTAHGLMALSALLTFVLVVSATKGSDARLRVAAARTDLPAGAAITTEALREVEVPADAELARATVRRDQIGMGDRVAAHPMAAGDLLRPSDLAGPGVGATQLRSRPSAGRDRRRRTPMPNLTAATPEQPNLLPAPFGPRSPSTSPRPT